MKIPVLFIGHGSPMNIILENDFTRCLVELGKKLPVPDAILVISAHWLTDGTYVTCREKQETIHDFYGFPDPLYRVNYPSPGSPANARLVVDTVKNPGIRCDNSWGLDHASWAVLKHMYPRADIPVFEMSLDYSPHNGWNRKSLQYHYELAKQLSFLREKGILVIGSGNIVHNLRIIDPDINGRPYPWAVEFDQRVKHYLLEQNHVELLNCQNIDKETSLSIPTLDHYLPMIYAIALQGKDEGLEFVYEGFQHGSISMRCFRIG
jgi:4,5-DOPA dioxygenase extradiol